MQPKRAFKIYGWTNSLAYPLDNYASLAMYDNANIQHLTTIVRAAWPDFVPLSASLSRRIYFG